MEAKKYLLEIYKVESEKYNKTRDIHWKMNISIWTILVFTIYAKFEHKIRNVPLFVQSIIFLIFFLLHFLFIKNIHGSLNRSLTRMNNIAIQLLEKPENEDVKWSDFNKKVCFKKGTWEYWQLGITAFLIWIFYTLE